jgi:hypothetical protein
MAGVARLMVQMYAPLIMAEAPERGQALPGSEPGVLDAQDPRALQAACAALRARDSAFDAKELTTFVEQLFAAVSSAWGTGDASGVRPFLADDVWNPLAGSLGSGMAALGAILAHQQGTATLTGAGAGEYYDSARFAIAINVDLPPDPGGTIPPQWHHWQEVWLLQRSVVPGGEAIRPAESCPSCGAPTATDPEGRCTHCHQPVPLRTAGWLVTAIRSDNPAGEELRSRMVDQVRQNPEMLAMLPDDLVRLVPADVVAQLDPQRAAALRLG